MKAHTKRSVLIKQDIEMDPYSTSILQDLLQNNQQWKGSDQIIKLTFRAMSDIIQIHGQSIKDIKHVLTTRASKTQLTTGLSLKANISDISNTIDQISLQIQQRPSYQSLNRIMKQYVHRSEINKLSDKSFQKQTKQIDTKQQSKANISTSNIEIQILKTRIDQFQKQVGKKLSNFVSLNEFQESLNIIDAKANANDLNQLAENLVTKQFLSNCLQKKINKNQVQSLLETKADVNDLEYIINSLQSKVNLTTLQKLTQVIENKADKSDIMMIINQKNSLTRSNQRNSFDMTHQKFEQLRSQLQNQITSLTHRLNLISQTKQQDASLSKKISALSNELHQSIHLLKLQQSKLISQQKIQLSEGLSLLKNQYKTLNQQITFRKNNDSLTRQLNNEINLRKRCEQKMYQQIDQLRKKIEDVNTKIYERNQNVIQKIRGQTQKMLQRKIDKQTLSNSLLDLEHNLNSKFQKQNQTNTLLLQKLQKIYSQAISTNTTDIVKLTKSLSKKQDKYQFSIIEQNMKKNRKQIQQCRKTVDKTYEQLQGKLSILQYQNDLLEIKKRFDKVFKEIENKANIKDVCILADSKPNIDDVNNALKQLNQVLNEKISQNQLQNILKDQSAINQTLCSQNIVGRWMWQSGDLKSGGLIPWEIESANTVPQHFFWEKDKTSILILAPGVYQVKACIFNKNSIINLLINGQNIDYSKNDQNTNTMNNVKSKSISQQGRKKGKGSCINGNSIEQFVILPARSRVSLCCLGQVAQGFINIKRL